MGKIQHSEGVFQSFDGSQLYEQSWLPESSNASIIIVHGYAEHSQRYTHVAFHLALHEFAVYTFDLRGHGKSSGDHCFVNFFNDYLTDLEIFLTKIKEREPGKPVFLLGHSMGGTISTLFAIKHQPQLRGLILSAPFLQVPNHISTLAIRLNALLSRVIPKLPTTKLDSRTLSRDLQVVKSYETDPLVYQGRTPARTGAEIIRATREIQLSMEAVKLPLLILHGTSDRLAQFEGSKQLYDCAGSQDKLLKLYDDLYHEVFNEPEKIQILEDLTMWLWIRLTENQVS
jgi:acylglycerol lipase